MGWGQETHPHISWPGFLCVLHLDSHLWIPCGIHPHLLIEFVDTGPREWAAVFGPAESPETPSKDGPLDSRGVQIAFKPEKGGLDADQLTTIYDTDERGGPEEDDEIEDQAHRTKYGKLNGETHDHDDKQQGHVLHEPDGSPTFPTKTGEAAHRKERLPANARPSSTVKDDGVVFTDPCDLAVWLDVPERRIVGVLHVVPWLIHGGRQGTHIAFTVQVLAPVTINEAMHA